MRDADTPHFPDPPPGYAPVEQLGVGGTGTVWSARQASAADRLVALKRVHPQLADADDDAAVQLRREAEVLASLDHPHILRIHEILDHGGHLTLVLQHAPKGSLADLLDRRGRLTPDEVVAVLAPVADALASAHRNGILHRDVKPANVLLTSDGAPLLADFGIARLRGGADTDGDGVSRGTAEYLDPRVHGGAPPDERADVYALAVTCYEALTGRPPYEGPDATSVLTASATGDCVPLERAAPGLPPALADAVRRGMGSSGPVPDAATYARLLRAGASGPGALGGLGEVAGAGVPAPATIAAGLRDLDALAQDLARRTAKTPITGPLKASGDTTAPGGVSHSRIDLDPSPVAGGVGPHSSDMADTGPVGVVASASAGLRSHDDAPAALLAPPTSCPAPMSAAPTPRPAPTGSHGPATSTFGPRPPREQHPAPPRPLPRTPLLALGGVAVTAAILVLGPFSGGGGEDSPTAALDPTTTTASPPTTAAAAACPPVEQRPGVLLADTDGDGCPVELLWDGEILEVPDPDGGPPIRLATGAEGDQLLVGDWDCNGTETPAVYRPGTGEVFTASTWTPEGDELFGTATDSGRPDGEAVVVTDEASGCDRVEVR